MRTPGKYIVIVDRSGCEDWQPVTFRKRKQPGTLASIWRHDAPVSLDYLISELRRYDYLNGTKFKINSTQAVALYHLLAKSNCIPELSLRQFYKALTTTYKVPFILRAMQGRKPWEQYTKDFINILPTHFQ